MPGDSLSDVVIVDVTNVGIQGPLGPPGPAGPAGPTGTTGLTPVTATGSTVPRALQDRFADRYSVLDWLTVGQPDGTTDNTAQIQAAITAAAGKAALVIPANVNNYIVGRLTTPSNTHLIIAQGATLFQKAAAGGTMFDVTNANNALIDHYGTINGNSAAQTTGGCGGIGGGPCSNVYVRGNRQGLITNTKHWPVNINSCTNGEVSGLTMTNAGASVEFTGLTTKQSMTVTASSYSTTTGAVSLTLAAAPSPPIAVGAVFTVTQTAGTVSTTFAGEFTATAGTGGTTLNYVTGLGGSGTSTLTAFTLGVCAKSYNVGFSDCVVSGVRDLGVCLYGGVVGGWIRNCQVYGCTSSGPSLLSDNGQPGANLNCEIIGNQCYNTLTGAGIGVASNAVGVLQVNTVVSNNIVYGNAGGGISCFGVDGVLIEANYVYNNLYGVLLPNGIGGDIAIQGLRVSVIGNIVRDPQLGSTLGYGIALYLPNNCMISGNRIGDYQKTPTMQACIGGSWGQKGLCEGNYYGPRIGATGDASTYGFGSVQGFSFDLVTAGLPVVGSFALNGLVSFATNLTGGVTTPGRGLTAGWNLSASAGEVDFLCGQGAAGLGGFNFIQVTNAGTISTGVGVNGSLLANDGYGNLRLSGAVVHGSHYNAALGNGGTFTIPPNVDFAYVQNVASIATGTIMFPTPSANSYQANGAGGWSELDILFLSQVGTLTMTAPGGYTVDSPPTSVTVARSNYKFALIGTTWTRRIMA